MGNKAIVTKLGVVVGLGLLLVAAACSSGDAGTDTETTASSGPAQEIKVSMGDFFYDPKDVTVEAGRVRFLLSNVGKTAHRFAVTGEGVKVSSRNVGAGRGSTLEVDLSPGTYKMGCTLGDHEARGSVGTIVVK